MAGGVRKRGKTWSYYFDLGTIEGQRKKKEKGGYRTKKEAETALAAAITEYKNAGRTFEPSNMTVADYLDYWLENVIHTNIGFGYTPDTYRSYETLVRCHLKPTFGQYRLSALQHSPDVIQRWVDSLKAKGYSKNTVFSLLTTLSGALKYAITPMQYISSNPCALVKVGRMPVDQERKAHNEYIVSTEEWQSIMEHFPESSDYHLALVLSYHLGTRAGETLGLHIEDVDFERHEIHIRRQIQKVNGNLRYRNPKYNSIRTLKIGATLEQEIKAAIRQHKLNQLQCGPEYQKTYLTPEGYIVQLDANVTTDLQEIHPLCVRANGNIMWRDSMFSCVQTIKHTLGYKSFHLHALRHTHGTILAENGVNPKTVMERMGHKNINTTLQIYTFNTDNMQSFAVDMFEKAIK